MSKYIDPENISKDDREYIRQRPTLHREFLMQGLGDPLEDDYPGLSFDPSEENESDEDKEAREAQEAADKAQQEAEEAQRKAEEERVVAEEAQRVAAEQNAPGPDDANHNADTPVEPSELPEEKQWTKSMTKGELENVVTARNADYSDDEQIEVEGTGKDGKVKVDDLIAALEQDDKELAGEE